MTATFRGFHGTLASRVESIRRSGIYPSDNPDDWLGEGTYFFIEGLDDPRTSAAQWARCKAWDRHDQEFDESMIAVVEVAIRVDDSRTFDLREPANARHFHRARRRWLKSRVPRRSTHLPRPQLMQFDTDLLDQFKQENAIAALIGDFHIQFSLRERHYRLDSRIPNVTVLCLSSDESDAAVEMVDVTIGPVVSFLEAEEW